MKAPEILETIKTTSIRITAERAAKILAHPDNLTTTDCANLVQSLHVVHHKDAPNRKSKLAGLDSISTSCLFNPFCAKMRERGASCICSHCYAATQQKQFRALNEHNALNALILTKALLPESELAFLPINTTFARIESFGDVANVTQARNYIRTIKAHPLTHFGIWSKRPGIWGDAFKAEGGKPKNCTFVLSSAMIDAPVQIRPSFSDHRFTVYTREAGKPITCGGGKHCADCIRAGRGCYFPESESNPYDVSELLK